MVPLCSGIAAIGQTGMVVHFYLSRHHRLGGLAQAINHDLCTKMSMRPRFLHYLSVVTILLAGCDQVAKVQFGRAASGVLTEEEAIEVSRKAIEHTVKNP